MANDDRPLDREIRIARVFRPLGTKPMTRSQAEMAGKLLGLHWTSVYRLRRRFLGDPVASSVAPMLRGPRPGDKRVAAPVEQIIADVLTRWLPMQRELAHPQLDTWMEIRRCCLHAALPAPGRNSCIDQTVDIDAKLARRGARMDLSPSGRTCLAASSLRRELSISPRYFKACAALLDSIR
jgi:hypothetical protein